MEFKYQQHKAVLDAKDVIRQVDASFGETFGRSYGGLVEAYRCEDADFIVVSLGSTTGTCRVVVDQLREEGWKAGVLKIRFMRPFPEEEIIEITRHAKAIAVIDRDISFGFEGTVYTNVNSALSRYHNDILKLNFIAGLGGRDISKESIRELFQDLKDALNGGPVNHVKFLNLGVAINE